MLAITPQARVVGAGGLSASAEQLLEAVFVHAAAELSDYPRADS
jgi:hypothetical protein